MINPESAAHRGFPVAAHIPRKPHARIQQELRPVRCQRGIADHRICLQHAIHKGVVRCAPARLIPAIGRLGPEPRAQLQPWPHLPGVFHERRTLQRPPSQLCRRRHHRERRHRPLQKRLQRTERCLPILILRQQIVRLDPLHPPARFQLMISPRVVNVVVTREQVPRRHIVAADVGARQRDLRSAVRRRAAADHDRSDRLAFHPSRHRNRRVASEVVARPRVPEPRRVQQPRRESVLLLHARHLLPQALVDQAQRILRRRIRPTVVHRVHREQQIARCQIRIEAGRPEILADVLFRMAERLRDAAPQLRPVRHRPQRQQRRHRRVHAHVLLRPRAVRQISLACLVVRRQRHRAQPPVLPEAFVVAEQKQLVPPQRPSQRAPKLIPLEFRNRSLIEKVPRIQRAVAQELEPRAVQRICARRRYNTHLRAVPLAVARAISIRHHVEFPHRVHAQQLPARPARRHVDQRCARVLNPVQQKQIVLRPPPAHTEHVPHRRVRCPHASRALRRVVHRRRIQRQQPIETPPVQRQLLHLPLVHQPRRLLRRRVHRRSLCAHHHLLLDAPQLQRHGQGQRLPYHQRNSMFLLRLEPRMCHRDRIRAHRQRRCGESPLAIGRQCSLGACLIVAHRHRRNRQARSCPVHHCPAQSRAHNLRPHASRTGKHETNNNENDTNSSLTLHHWNLLKIGCRVDSAS